MASQANNDLYGILGVNKNATDEEIKKAYHRLAREFHPDKNPNTENKFKEVGFAHAILSDPEKRQVYDKYGIHGLKNGARPAGKGSGGESFEDLFGEIFGGACGGGSQGRRKRQTIEDMVYPLKVTLENLYNGKTFNLQIKKNVICAKCQGLGGKAGAWRSCKACHGSGIKMSLRKFGKGMRQQVQGVCPKCSGIGEVMKDRDRCKVCGGKKVLPETKPFEVNIDKGMKDGQKIMMREEGDQFPGIKPGNVIVILEQRPHKHFQRIGNDLYTTHQLTLVEALCGVTFSIKHLDDRCLLISSPEGGVIEPGAQRRIPNEGMPTYKHPFDKGHLYVKFEVKFPPNSFIDANHLEKLESLLPPRTVVDIPHGEHIEEVNMIDFDPTTASAGDRRRGKAYKEDEDDDPGFKQVPCTHQ